MELDRDLAASVDARAVDLADRSGGDRLVVEVLEGLRSGSPNSPSITMRISLTATFGAESRSWRELALGLLAVVGGDEADVQERDHLASFIAAPFIVASTATICSAVSI